MRRSLQTFALLGMLLLPFAASHAQDLSTAPASGYTPVSGESFFLLSDQSYGSDEVAQVRLEAPGRDYRRYLMEQYSGADIRVYRIDQPLDFLKRQKNLHRVAVDGRFKGEGLSNTLAYLWDNWYKKSRLVMQRAFASDTRQEIVANMPELSIGNALQERAQFQPQTQFAPIPGLPLVSQFRYPLWDAKPIMPPESVRLAGSSSEFIQVVPGNVYIPLGKLQPGLYLVEALVGKYRAITVVFVSNTVAISKVAGNELLAWTVNKRKGVPAPKAQLLWTDGMGVMMSGKTDDDGLLSMKHLSPERSYLIGEDSEGGVFVSENFYYDSEIYDTKLYAFTDRPMYRPGDWVSLKIVGREFKNSRDSAPAESSPIRLTVLDANGSTLQTLNLKFDGKTGANERFQLPENAVAGGYEMRLSYKDQLYSSAFRVADYIKPHFEVSLEMDKADFRTGEPVTGTLALLYPDGKPVVNANLQLTLRAQQLSMINDDLQYLGQFPIELKTAELKTDSKGRAQFNLPATDKPSRYLLTVFANDGAAYRVKVSKEILIERGAAKYRLSTAKRFSMAGEAVAFQYASEQDAAGNPAVAYQWIRLEDQSKNTGTLSDGTFNITFEKAGNYNILLKDEHGQILGGTSHAVSGEGVKAVAGSIDIVLDKSEYKEGENALALITFPEPVEDALLSLERDKVEATSLLSKGANWLTIKRLNPTQYQAIIPVTGQFSPNLTFSVLYTKGNDYSFQNAGIKVSVPQIDIAITTDKERYQPGELVTVDLSTQFVGKPIPAHLTVSVVDEMIYALQPEIAPEIDRFFYHPRRNNVRTSASLSFISYDVALPGTPTSPGKANRSERGVKMLERPRREDVDTAAWEPELLTGKDGKARFTFRVPDSLTRWRITVRALDDNGQVGQKKQFVRSEKPLYLKWSGPTEFRNNDQPKLGMFVFNQADGTAKADLVTTFAGNEQRTSLSLTKGINYIALPAFALSDGELRAELHQDGKLADALAVRLRVAADDWQLAQTQTMAVQVGVTPLSLPADAQDIRLHLNSGMNTLFRSALGNLLDMPYGGVEQTASRLLPASVAYARLSQGDTQLRDKVRQSIQNNRLRLMYLAGPEAHFTWWGSGDDDAFLTAYAYYADWFASYAVGVQLPPEHWQRVLNLYAEQVNTLAPLQRALILNFAYDMRLPVTTLLTKLIDDLSHEDLAKNAIDDLYFEQSMLLWQPNAMQSIASARVIAADLARRAKVTLPAAFSELVPAARSYLEDHPRLFSDALLISNQTVDPGRVQALLQRLSTGSATVDRALALSWLEKNIRYDEPALTIAPDQNWYMRIGSAGERYWAWRGKGVPATLTLSGTQPPILSATLDFQSSQAPASALPVAITRTLLRLVPGDTPYTFSLEELGTQPLSTDSLYLDVVTLSSDQRLVYGMLDVPLPPGADVERTTWGLTIKGLESGTLNKAINEPGELSYGVPVEKLLTNNPFEVRHLVRFSQKGQFTLPPVRYRQLYAPLLQGLERNPTLRQITVE